MQRRESYLETAEDMAEKAIENTPSRFYFLATLGAIAFSALLFVSGRRTLALFLGQWPPTILALGLVSKLLHPSQK